MRFPKRDSKKNKAVPVDWLVCQ
uniref:Uncharacterized protein n=1 Tax=Anguilla anguilla TaxID=7936 RepID=A0A0E9RUC3_ANGAN